MKHAMDDKQMGNKHYAALGIMFVLHFIAMYFLMYAMVYDLRANAYNGLNQVYMAALMTSSMIGIELVLMRSMYPNKKWNAVILIASLALLFGSWTFIRQQTAISDQQFVRSMIPHHAGAVLMCQQASIHDTEVQNLCKEIISSQQSQIDQMKAILKRLDQ